MYRQSLRFQVICHTVGRDGASAVTNVEDADLAALQEIMGAEVWAQMSMPLSMGTSSCTGMQPNVTMRSTWLYTATTSSALYKPVISISIADFLRGVTLEIALIAGIADIHKSESSLPPKRM